MRRESSENPQQQPHPELWIWTGDAVYAKNQTLAGLRAAYESLTRNVYYQRFTRQVFIDGIWDDHDLGVNDAGILPDREARASLYHTFLNSGRLLKRKPASVATAIVDKGGLYHSKVLKKDAGRAKIIFLDTRYSREQHFIPSLGQIRLPFTALAAAAIRSAYSLLSLGRTYEGDVLGEAQWRWLEEELSSSHRGRVAAHDASSPAAAAAAQAAAAAAAHPSDSFLQRQARESNERLHRHDFDFHILVSSIQLFTSNPAVESWGHFPAAKRRLVSLLERYDPSGLLVLSGDVHHGETVSVPVFLDEGVEAAAEAAERTGGAAGAAARERAPHRVWLEVTSSGLTHTAADGLVNSLLCPLMLAAFARHRREGDGVYLGRNFGSVVFDKVRVRVRVGAENRPDGGMGCCSLVLFLLPLLASCAV